MALQIMEKLEIVRKMVSSACGGTPLDRGTVFARKVDLTSVDGQALAGHGLGSNLSVEDVHAVYDEYNMLACMLFLNFG
jgi:hypothetical protein